MIHLPSFAIIWYELVALRKVSIILSDGGNQGPATTLPETIPIPLLPRTSPQTDSLYAILEAAIVGTAAVDPHLSKDSSVADTVAVSRPTHQLSPPLPARPLIVITDSSSHPHRISLCSHLQDQL